MSYRRFPKLALVVDCRTHLILAAVSGRGPSPDCPHVREALRAARERRQIQAVLADAGYDAEWVHQFIRDELDMRSFIPPTAGRPTDKPPAGRYRRAMRTYFRRPKQRRRYGQRWQVETVFSMIKRRLGECVNACSDRRQRRAMLLKAIVHNILILLLIRPFLQSSCVPVSTRVSTRATASAQKLAASPYRRSSPYRRCVPVSTLGSRVAADRAVYQRRARIVAAHAAAAVVGSRVAADRAVGQRRARFVAVHAADDEDFAPGSAHLALSPLMVHTCLWF